MHARNNRFFFRITIDSCKFMQPTNFLQIYLCVLFLTDQLTQFAENLYTCTFTCTMMHV